MDVVRIPPPDPNDDPTPGNDFLNLAHVVTFNYYERDNDTADGGTSATIELHLVTGARHTLQGDGAKAVRRYFNEIPYR